MFENTCRIEGEGYPTAIAIGVWENEGGADGPDQTDQLCGRRIDIRSPWAQSHVIWLRKSASQ